jgi:hypothetical protein
MRSKSFRIQVLLLLTTIPTLASCNRASDEKATPVPAQARQEGAKIDEDVDPEVAEARAHAAKIAAMTREERRKWWGGDPVERAGPPIETVLPRLSTVKDVTGWFTGDDGKNVEFSIAKSDWPALFELFGDSLPVELESEILQVGYLDITAADGEAVTIVVLSSFANPIIYAVHKPQAEGPLHFATLRTEPEVLGFFESVQDARHRRKLSGWYY